MERSERRTVEALAALIVSVADAARADAIICTTETGELAAEAQRRSPQIRVIAATTHESGFAALDGSGISVFQLPVQSAERYRQIPLVVSVAVRAQFVSKGDLVVCAIGHEGLPASSDLIVLTDVEEDVTELAVSDLITLTDGIRPRVLEAAVFVAGMVARAAQRGKRIGAIFMLGDSVKVREGSRQLIPNPFKGHDPASRMLNDPAIHQAIVELAKLDGAFVIRGDGLIVTAGTFLAVDRTEVTLPSGLGARHVAAAAATARTSATGVVVSATDGQIRIFSGGRLVLQIAPDVPYGLIGHAGLSRS